VTSDVRAGPQTSSTPTEREGLALSDNIEIITRFEHAFRAADIWTQFDGVALMQQLGAIPA
jgi:hypothetical protein